MLSFETDRLWFRRSGLVLFLLQLSLFVFTLQPFHYGTWYLVEPTMLAMLAFSAFNALWLAAGLSKRWLVIERPLHPWLLCMLAWVAWQWMVTVFSHSPWRSWFGTSGTGEGAAFYTSVLLSYLLGVSLWKIPKYRLAILGLATFNMVVLAWANFYPAHLCRSLAEQFPELLPAVGDWPDYLGFVAGYLWIAFMTTSSVRTPARYSWMVIICSLVVVGVARNKAALVFVMSAMVVGQILAWLYVKRRPAWLVPDKRWRGLATAACMAPLLWIGFSQSTNWIENSGCSMSMRALYNQVSVSTLQHEPARLALGAGWGRYQDDLFKYAMVDGVRAYYKGMHSPNWDMVDGEAFHAHNEPMEILLSLGIPGLLLWLAFPVIILWTLPGRLFWWGAPMLIAMVWLQSLWFYLPLVMGYQALMWVALTAHGKRGTQQFMGRIPAVICAVIALVMLWSAYAQWQAMAYGVRLSSAMRNEESYDYDVNWLSEDMSRGGDRFRPAAIFYSNWVSGRVARGEADARDAGWYWLFMQAAHKAAMTPDVSPWLAYSDVWLHNKLFMNGKDSPLDTLKPQARDTFPESVIRLSELAPMREDKTALFLSFLGDFTRGNEAQQMEILTRILDVAPDHRAALWIKGHHLLQMPGHEEEGKAMIARAEALGVDRVFPNQ